MGFWSSLFGLDRPRRNDQSGTSYTDEPDIENPGYTRSGYPESDYAPADYAEPRVGFWASVFGVGRRNDSSSGYDRDDERADGGYAIYDSEIESLRHRRPLMSSGGDADAGDSKSTQVDPYGIDRAGVDRGEDGGYHGDSDTGDSNTRQVDPYGFDSRGRDYRD